jgi:ribonuclease-3
MQNLNDIEKILNIKIKNPSIIKNAFIHKSYLNEINDKINSNERLEFLGDSVLSYLVSNYLYDKFPELEEGSLTNLRASLVKTSTLATISKELKLGDYLFLSKGEEESGGRNNTSILADVFESFLGAIYLDQGIGIVKKILKKYLYTMLDKIIKEKLYKDPKSTLQEKVQTTIKSPPIYKLLEQSGPDHSKNFKIGVYVQNKLYGIGYGKNKHQAETEAAKNALEKWS